MSDMPSDAARREAGAAVVSALMTGDVLALQPRVHPLVVDHSATPGQPAGWPGLRERVMALCASCPEPDVPVEVIYVDGEITMCRVQVPGLPGHGHGPASMLALVFVLRFEGDLLRELWTSTDISLPVEAYQPADVGVS